MTLIGVLSDFGLRDSYVAQMKAVILTICPSATIVDISHEVEKFNIQQGMFVLASAVPRFPEGSIFLAVVDPGVGGARRPLLFMTQKSKLVGPDNGLLALAAEKEGIVNAYHLTESQYFADSISPTFEGRDVFAHVAGHLANGISPSMMGPEIHDYVRSGFSSPKIEKSEIRGVVVHVDSFGNVVTNIDARLMERQKMAFGSDIRLRIGIGVREITYCKTYSDVGPGELLATIGGHGFLELAVNKGSAARLIALDAGDTIIIQSVGCQSARAS
jgi:S-adenosylmethionine hydrolase